MDLPAVEGADSLVVQPWLGFRVGADTAQIAHLVRVRVRVRVRHLVWAWARFRPGSGRLRPDGSR